MPGLLVASVARVVSQSTAPQGEALSAATVVRSAERAVQDDSLPPVKARWEAVLARDSTDPAAALGLATIARQTYDFARAERLLTGLLARRTGTVDPWTVQARLGLYRVANSRGEVRAADSLLQGAVREARRLGDRPAEIAGLIGFTNTRSGDPRALYATLDSVLPLLPPGDSRDRAEYLCRRGLYAGVRGEADASTLVRQGIAMAERTGERQLTGHCLEAEGLLESFRNHNDSALVTMDRALGLLRATHEHAGIARLESRRSDILQAYGRLGEAKVALSQVLAHATVSGNRQRLANAYGGMGMLALRVGDLHSAADQFGRAAALNDSLGLVEAKLITQQNVGEVKAALGDLEGARVAFQQVLDQAGRVDIFEPVVLMRQALARLAIRRRDWADARRQLDAADSSARARGFDDMRGPIEYDRGRLALAQGDAGSAVRLLTDFLGRTSPDDHLIRYTVRTRLAQAWAASGDLDRAERELTEAGSALEAWRASLGADELRRYAFAATTLGEYDPQGATAAVIAALARGGRASAAFTLAEARRARALADRLTQAEALRETAATSTLHRDRPATAAAIAAGLPDGRTAVVEFVAGTEGAPTTMFLVTRSGVAVRLLPTADSLAAPAERYAALLEAGDSATALARSLGATVMTPLAALAPDSIDHLIMVPDGPLHRLAFDALRLPDGRAALERWTISLAPSAAVATVLLARGNARPTASATLLALGDPVFANEGRPASNRDGEVFRGAYAAAGGLPRLTASGEEARDVARFAPAAEVRLRHDASEAWLKHTPVDRFRVIHLATHALVDEGSIARTSLALAPGAGEDGFLSPADLAALKLGADLVVLSACRTAGGVMVAGEGVQGLTTPLLEAGARSVVATQWRIGDRSTVRLVHDLYAGLARGATVADALRAAKLAALHRGSPAGEWAGFTVVGDPMVRVPLRVPATDAAGRWIGLGGAVLAAGGWLLWRRGRRTAGSVPAAA